MYSLYQDLYAAGLVTGHRQSDLYCRNTPLARTIIKRHGRTPEAFTDQVTGEPSLEVPFAYEPFWNEKAPR